MNLSPDSLSLFCSLSVTKLRTANIHTSTKSDAHFLATSKNHTGRNISHCGYYLIRTFPTLV